MKWAELELEEKKLILFNTGKKVRFPLYIIEKDWWVVQTLRLVSRLDIAEHIVFKGGTSLSKAWGLIDRFSEDIDLAINREFFGFRGEISRTQVGKLKDVSSKYISNDFRLSLQQAFIDEGFKDVRLAVVDEKSPDDDPVKIAVFFPSITEYSAYVKPSVLLEIGSRSLIEPSTLLSFRSMIGQTFPDLPFADLDVSIRCVNPERTFLEKLFLLHEEHQRPPNKMQIKGKSRHLYDKFCVSCARISRQSTWKHAINQPVTQNGKLFYLNIFLNNKSNGRTKINYLQHRRWESLYQSDDQRRQCLAQPK